MALRQTLAQHGKDCGAAAIQQGLAQQGIEPVPSPRAIYWLLHRYAQEVTSTTTIILSISEQNCSRYYNPRVKGIWPREAMCHG